MENAAPIPRGKPPSFIVAAPEMQNWSILLTFSEILRMATGNGLC